MGSDGTVISESVRARPAPGLAGLVAHYSGYRQAGVAPAAHTGLPSPFLTLIFTLHEPLTVARHPDPAQPAASYRALAGGLHTRPALITHDGRQSGVQVGLSPLGARALLGLPAGELAHIDLDAGGLLGPLAAEVCDRLAAAPGWAERFAVLDEVLTARLAAAPEGVQPAAPLRLAWASLLHSGGQAGIGALAAQEIGRVSCRERV